MTYATRMCATPCLKKLVTEREDTAEPHSSARQSRRGPELGNPVGGVNARGDGARLDSDHPGYAHTTDPLIG